ncbi:restriction endonuclease subunit S [Intestinibacter bartlettii]|uniref:restriction endonuclease subunit S n=1 Tax=Intestinibacter bartlettii TaxID=261299 RepID=UPI002EA91850|nr:restriction endonuclease subunit S [Intestinibacter bartlettii]
MVPKLRFKEFCGEWEEKRLGDIADVLSGKRIPKGMSLSTVDTGIKYITVSDMGEKYINNENIKYISEDIEEKIKKYKVSENDIIISVAGTLGKINIVTKDFQNANLTENCDKITNLKGIKHKYLYMYLNSSYIQGQINSIYTVSSQPKLALTRIRDFIINTPSLVEQTKIADFLSTVDDKIQNQQDKITHLENIKKGFMQKIFSRKIRFKDDGGEEFPEWEEKKLVDCCKYQSSSISTSMISNSGEYQLFDVNGKIGYTNKFCDKKYISIIKDGAGVGRIRILPKNSFCISTMGIITSNKQTIIEYLYYSMSQIEFKKYVVGAAIPHIYFKDYRNEKIEVPCLKEQTKIADFLSSFDEKISIEKETLEHLKQLKKGLLQQMFV